MLCKHTTNNKFSIIHRCCYSIMLLCYLLLLLLGEGIASFTLAILLPLRRLQQSYGFTPWGAGKMAWLETAEMTLPAGNLSGASSFCVSSELISFLAFSPFASSHDVTALYPLNYVICYSYSMS